MTKRLLLILALCLPAFVYGQAPTSTSDIPLSPPPVYVASLNGSSQYFSKTSPAKGDLNGSEVILNANDRGFEDSVANWAGTGNHAIVRTTGDKRTGTASGRISSSGAGDTTSNYVTLPGNAYTIIADGNKATLEVYARSGTATTTLSLNIADTTLTSGNLSTTPGSFTKVVFNYRLTAARAGAAFRWYLNKAVDSVFVDDVSLTQAYDWIVFTKVKTSEADGVIYDYRETGASTSPGHFLSVGTGSRVLIGSIGDNVGRVLAISTAVAGNNVDHTVAYTIDRTSTTGQRFYLDGVQNGTTGNPTTVGVVRNSASLFIGTATVGSVYGGTIGEVLMVRYPSLPSDIATWIAHANTQRFIPEPPGGGETVLRVFGRRPDALDQSGNQGVLTNTGSTPIIQKQ